MHRRRHAFATGLAFVALASAADDQTSEVAGIDRVPLPGGSTFPISSAVGTGAQNPLVYFSGIVPLPKDADAPFRSRAYWGDTREQTLNVLQRIEAMLAGMDLGLKNAVKMTAYLVGDPALDGRMDFDGFMAAYTEFFGTADQPELPARSAVQVERLANEGMLVEIELVLARSSVGQAVAMPVPAGGASGEPVTQTCILCHGTGAHGNSVVGAPNLSILAPWYIQAQLRAYRDGTRGTHPADLFGPEMQPVAARLSDEEIVAAIEEVSAAPSNALTTNVEGDAEHGAELYAGCAGCHGADAAGIEEVGGPRLAGQNDWYLVRQLEAYRAGLRPSGDGSTAGAQMAAAAQTLAAPTAIRDVVAYINSLGGSAPAALNSDGE